MSDTRSQEAERLLGEAADMLEGGIDTGDEALAVDVAALVARIRAFLAATPIATATPPAMQPGQRCTRYADCGPHGHGFNQQWAEQWTKLEHALPRCPYVEPPASPGTAPVAATPTREQDMTCPPGQRCTRLLHTHTDDRHYWTQVREDNWRRTGEALAARCPYVAPRTPSREEER